MIRIFENESTFPDKINFVDDNNVLVGYDLDQICCENANWFISDQQHQMIPAMMPEKKTILEGRALKDFVFDPAFFERREDDLEASMVIFRLVDSEGQEKFLHLFNVHNGYYSHGFEVKHGEETVKNGKL